MRRSIVWFILILAILGMAASGIATHQYFQVLERGLEAPSFCTISETINCDAAYATSHAQLFGIPVSWFGFLYYLLSFGLAGWILWQKSAEAEAASAGWVLSLGAVGMSFYKAYVSFMVLHLLCLLCLAMYAVNALLLLAWHLFLGIGRHRFSQLSFRPHWKTLGVVTLLLFAVGGFGMADYQAGRTAALKLPVSPREFLHYHFRQSEYQFEVDPNRPVWGNPNAKVVMVDFSDFQCPHCQRAAFHLRPVLTEFKDKVRLYYYHYPIDPACNEEVTHAAHSQSCLAAQASVCAEQRGDFWSYHDDLYRRQKRLGEPTYLELARQRGWNEQEFLACLNAPETIEAVKKDIAAARRIHLNATPTILLNNRLVRYWADPEILRALVKEEIKRHY